MKQHPRTPRQAEMAKAMREARRRASSQPMTREQFLTQTHGLAKARRQSNRNMKQNPIPLTLALAPFDRLETLSKVASRLDTLRVQLDESKANDDKVRALRDTRYTHLPYASEHTTDLEAEIDALQAVHDLASASTGDTIFLSTHAYSLLA